MTDAIPDGELRTDPPITDSATLWLGERERIWSDILPLAINYFAPTARFSPAKAQLLARGDIEADDWKAYVRGLLADATDLLDVVRAIIRSPNFRYQRENVESVGNLRGRLDFIKYSRSRNRREVPRRYPIQEIGRAPSTPENLLAATALESMLENIRDVLSLNRLETTGPEARWAKDLESALGDVSGTSQLKELRAKARASLDAGQESFLLEQVRIRLKAGHASGQHYESLCSWADRALLRRSILESGSEPALIYGEAFDDRLFELWVLAQVLLAMSAWLGPPTMIDWTLSMKPNRGPWASWASAGWSIWYRPRLTSLGCGDTAWDMGGEPDIVLIHEAASRSRRLMLVDAKRRRTEGRPSELLYKLLGYFENLPDLNPLCGGIVYWSPDGFRESPSSSQRSSFHRVETRPEAPRTGQMLAVGVSPADALGTQRALNLLIHVARQVTGAP
jgi:hypothetical protein